MNQTVTRRAGAIVGALLMVAVASRPVAAYPRPGLTERVSVATDGSEGNAFSSGAAISADGRYVALLSAASNLAPDDTGRGWDVFVRDRVTGATERVSVDSDGSEANSSSSRPTISDDGRYVAFTSTASNLVPGDTNDTSDVFVHDRQTGTTERASVASDDTEGNGPSSDPAISADGRYVAFLSTAFNLVPGDTNDTFDVFVNDRRTGTTERVSVASDDTEGNGLSSGLAISEDGHFVAFSSTATNLVPGDTNGAADVFVHDRHTGTTERVSVASDGRQALATVFTSSPLFSGAPAISADGRHVAFLSTASNLVPADTNDTFDVFVHDRHTGTTERVSVASDGSQSRAASAASSAVGISANGRYVAFGSFAANLVNGDTNDRWDAFVHDRHTRATERVSVASNGSQAQSTPASATSVAISADGRHVAFPHFAPNLVPADTNNTWDVFVRDRGNPLGPVGEPSRTMLEEALTIEGRITLTGVVIASAAAPVGDGPSAARAVGATLTDTAIVYRPERDDLLVRIGVESFPDRCQPGLGTGQCNIRDQVRGRCLVTPCPVPEAGLPGVVYGVAFEVGSTRYEARATEVAATGVVTSRIPYVALYECAVTCLEVAPLGGAIGSTGNEVVMSVPLATLDARQGQRLASLRAFAGIGGATPGTAMPLEELGLPDALIPVAGVDLGIAPVGTAEDHIAFDTPAALVEGTFTGSLDVAALPAGEYEVWTRTCLGQTCHTTPTAVTLAGTMDPTPTTLQLTVNRHGHGFTLTARLTVADSPNDPIPGRTIRFVSDDEPIGAQTTDAEGIASVEVPPGHRGANRTYEAVFDGDEAYDPSLADRPGKGGDGG